MHLEILTKEQEELLPLVKMFSSEFGLVGGTAIALQLGHRESIDFDLFKNGNINILKIRKRVSEVFHIENVRVEEPEEYTITVNGVRLTFLNYPFNIKYTEKLEHTIKIPDILTLGAMKAFALGKRAKWKDYVDLYFIFRKHSLEEVTQKSAQIFGNEFNGKLFREQLSYYEDIDYTEQIVFMPKSSVSNEEIKKNLIEISLS